MFLFVKNTMIGITEVAIYLKYKSVHFKDLFFIKLKLFFQMDAFSNNLFLIILVITK